MFDIGFWELIVIAVVALLVFGPDKLPGMARTAGLWLGRMRRFVSNVQADIERELRAEELRRALERDAGLDEVKKILGSAREEVEHERDYLVKSLDDSDGRPRADRERPDPDAELARLSEQSKPRERPADAQGPEQPDDKDK